MPEKSKATAHPEQKGTLGTKVVGSHLKEVTFEISHEKGDFLNSYFLCSRESHIFQGWIPFLNKILCQSPKCKTTNWCFNGIHLRYLKFITFVGTSLVAQWLRIRPPIQGTRVQVLVQEDLSCHEATKSLRHNY